MRTSQPSRAAAALFLWLALLQFTPARADPLNTCGSACWPLSGLAAKFPKCAAGKTFYECIFFNMQQRTFALCCHDYCPDPEAAWRGGVQAIVNVEPIIKPWSELYDETLANATTYLAPAPANKTELVYHPVTVEYETFELRYRALVNDKASIETIPNSFSWIFLMFTAVAVAGAAVRYAWLVFHSKRSQDGRQPKANKVGVFTKKYLLMPAIFHSTSHRPSLFGFTFSLPTRMQTVLIFLFVMLNAIACGWDLHNEVTWSFDSASMAAVDYVADRTGIYAVYNMPLLFAFAGRNNILIQLTGSSFDTFNVFHKWIGRVIIVQAAIHSVLYTYEFLHDGGYAELALAYSEPYLQWGAAATVAGCLIAGLAIHVARKYYYEAFLVVHIVLSIAYTFTTWYHIRLLDYKVEPKWGSYLSWMVAACVIWALDRTIRVIRIVLFNLSYQQGRIKTSKGVVAEVSPGLFTITIQMARDWKFVPGQYCFLHFGKRHHLLQSHPFTILSYEDADSLPLSAPGADKESGKDAPHSVAATTSKLLTLVVRQHKGVTKQLSSLSLGSASTVLVEGPYGHGLPLQNYDNLTLLAAGVGITGILPHARLAATQAHTLLHFVWIVRSSAEVQGLRHWLEKAQHPSLKISIYVSGELKEGSIKEDKEQGALVPGFAGALYYGRPMIENLLAEDAAHAGSWAVVACGPGPMLDDARASCVHQLSTKSEPIDFFSEGFEW